MPVARAVRRGYRFAFSLSHDATRAEDLLQEAWVSVLRADGPHTPGYLFATIRSRFVDQYRRALIVRTDSLDSQPHVAAEVEAAFWTEPFHRPSGRQSRDTTLRARCLRPSFSV